MFNDLIRYQVQNPSGDYTRPLRLGATVRKVRARFRGDTGIVITNPHGHRSDPPVGHVGLQTRLTQELRDSTLGVIRIESPRHEARVRKIQTRIKVADTTGNEKVDAYFGELVGKFRGVRNLGALVCKSIGSTSTPSQHSNWPGLPNWKGAGFSSKGASAGGNAIDSGNASRKVLDEMWRWSVANADRHHAMYIIHWPESSAFPLVWNPEVGIHRYVVPPGGDDHKFHVHWDARPTRTGKTLC